MTTPSPVLSPAPLPGLGLSVEICAESATALGRLLADSIALREIYKKHHWQASGPTFHPLHRLFDSHHAAQAEVVDALAERVMTLGGTPWATPQDVAEQTRIARAPAPREAPEAQIRRLLAAHEVILVAARAAARAASDRGDEGTDDLVVGQVVRTGEAQVWTLAEHLRRIGEAG
jgi:starvation-inducible DNA-binding protein